jgi:hypothetical protein
MATRIHRTLKVITFNANGIMKQRFELSKQLQDLHACVALFSETHLKPHERDFISNYHFYRTDRHPGRKVELSLRLEEAFPITMSTYHPLFQHKR